MVEELFGDWPRRAIDPFKEFPLVEHPPLPKSEGAIIKQPVQNVIIELGWQGPSIGKDDAATYTATFTFNTPGGTLPGASFPGQRMISGTRRPLS